MSDNSFGSDHRVIRFPGARPQAGARDHSAPAAPAPKDDDFHAFESDGEPDDYRHRMMTNLAGFAVVLVLIGAGLWLADTMAAMRKNQECVLSGRRGCTPVDVTVQPRW
jgi:hypothetical protein